MSEPRVPGSGTADSESLAAGEQFAASAGSVVGEPTVASRTGSAIRSATLWLGPAAALSDASLLAGIWWFAALVAALWSAPAVFGLLLTAVAALGAWQAVGIRSAPQRVTGRAAGGEFGGAAAAQIGAPAGALDRRHRLPAAALAGAVGLAGAIDTRLAGVVLAAAVVASFIVVAALRRAQRTRRAAPGTAARRGAQAEAALSGWPGSAELLSRIGSFVRTWLLPGVAAACAASVARYSLGAALVLVSAAAFYDAAMHLSAAGRSGGLRAPVTGAAAAAIVVFAFTGLSAPPFGPADAARFGLIAAFTLPLGSPLARGVTALAERPRDSFAPLRGRGDPPTAGPTRPKPTRVPTQALLERAAREWGVRRLDSLSVASLGWMWGLGLL